MRHPTGGTWRNLWNIYQWWKTTLQWLRSQQAQVSQDNDPVDTMEMPKVSTEPEDPSAPGRESTTETESEKQLQMFVTMLALRLLYKCKPGEVGRPYEDTG